MGEEEFMIAEPIDKLQHYIIPITDFSIDIFDDNFIYVFDEDLRISLKKFDYENDMERVDADHFSVLDHSELKIKYKWGFRFDCKKNEALTFLERVNLILLAFRIYSEADCTAIYLLNVTIPYNSYKETNIWKRAIANRKHNFGFDIKTLDKVKIGYLRLKSFYSTSLRTKHSVQFLYLGYTSNYWMQAFILFMTSLEALLSPPTEDQITTKIIKRTRNLINDTKLCSKNIMDHLYELRSDIIHGRILVGLNFIERIDDMVKLQIIVLRAFERMLEKDFASIYQNEESKELFFQQLEKHQAEV